MPPKSSPNHLQTSSEQGRIITGSRVALGTALALGLGAYALLSDSAKSTPQQAAPVPAQASPAPDDPFREGLFATGSNVDSTFVSEDETGDTRTEAGPDPLRGLISRLKADYSKWFKKYEPQESREAGQYQSLNQAARYKGFLERLENNNRLTEDELNQLKELMENASMNDEGWGKVKELLHTLMARQNLREKIANASWISPEENQALMEISHRFLRRFSLDNRQDSIAVAGFEDLYDSHRTITELTATIKAYGHESDRLKVLTDTNITTQADAQTVIDELERLRRNLAVQALDGLVQEGMLTRIPDWFLEELDRIDEQEEPDPNERMGLTENFALKIRSIYILLDKIAKNAEQLPEYTYDAEEMNSRLNECHSMMDLENLERDLGYIVSQYIEVDQE